MKIKGDNEICFHLPNSGVHSIVLNNQTEILIDYLSDYFVKKKKSKCVIVDDDNDVINNNDAEFIYVSFQENIDSFFEFKPKTLFNEELSRIVLENDKMFMSISKVREALKDSLTDSGMYKFINIIQNNIDSRINIDISNYDLSKIIQMYHFDTEEMTVDQKYLAIYNLLLYLNRNTFCVIYIDFPAGEHTYNWLINNKKDNHLILVNNKELKYPIDMIFDSIIILNNCDFVEEYEIDIESTELYTYLFHPLIQEFKNQQTEKNIEIMNQFTDKTSTFFLKFTSYDSENSL